MNIEEFDFESLRGMYKDELIALIHSMSDDIETAEKFCDVVNSLGFFWFQESQGWGHEYLMDATESEAKAQPGADDRVRSGPPNHYAREPAEGTH